MDKIYYTKILHELRDALGISNNEYVVVDTASRIAGPDGWCRMSKREIGKIAGISRRSVTNIVEKLTDQPPAARILEKSPNGNLRTTKFWGEMKAAITAGKPLSEEAQKGVELLSTSEKKVPTPKKAKWEESSQSGGKKVPKKWEESSHPNIHRTSNNTLSLFDGWEESSQSGNGKAPSGTSQKTWYGKSADELFENHFWENYPDRGPKAIKGSKQKAKEYFEKLLVKESEDPKQIIYAAIGLRRATEDKQGEDRRTIPMATTFLNRGDWREWWEKVADKLKPKSPSDLLQSGFMLAQEAEQYSQEHFREPLSETRGSFKIIELKGQEFFKPRDEQ